MGNAPHAYMFIFFLFIKFKNCSLRHEIEYIVTSKIYIKIQYILNNDYVSFWQGWL